SQHTDDKNYDAVRQSDLSAVARRAKAEACPPFVPHEKMVGTARVRLCPPYEAPYEIPTCIADRSPPTRARAAATAARSIRRDGRSIGAPAADRRPAPRARLPAPHTCGRGCPSSGRREIPEPRGASRKSALPVSSSATA